MRKNKFNFYLALIIVTFTLIPITNTTSHSSNSITEQNTKEKFQPLHDTDIGKIYHE